MIEIIDTFIAILDQFLFTSISVLKYFFESKLNLFIYFFYITLLVLFIIGLLIEWSNKKGGSISDIPKFNTVANTIASMPATFALLFFSVCCFTTYISVDLFNNFGKLFLVLFVFVSLLCSLLIDGFAAFLIGMWATTNIKKFLILFSSAFFVAFVLNYSGIFKYFAAVISIIAVGLSTFSFLVKTSNIIISSVYAIMAMVGKLCLYDYDYFTTHLFSETNSMFKFLIKKSFFAGLVVGIIAGIYVRYQIEIIHFLGNISRKIVLTIHRK